MRRPHPLLEPSPFVGDGGQLIGRDPRTLSAAEFSAHLPEAPVGLRAIRLKCFDCAGGDWGEVRKCVVLRCPLWPLRMGSQPGGLRTLRKSALEAIQGASGSSGG